MGEVYLAADITAGRKAALKFLPLRFTGDAERLKRFQQEAHALVGLNHPNIADGLRDWRRSLNSLHSHAG